MPEATQILERAASYATDNPRILENLAIAYWQQEKINSSITSFNQALKLSPDNHELLQRQKWDAALPYAMHMAGLLLGNIEVEGILAHIERSSTP